MKVEKTFSKLLVTLIIFLNVSFTSAILYLFYLTGNEPSVLIGSWFAFTTGELWLLASIKKKEITDDTVKHISENEDIYNTSK